MNNNLYFNRHHPQREWLQSMLNQYRKVPACGRPQGPLPPSLCPHVSAFDQLPLSLQTSFMDGPLAVSRERCVFHVDRVWTSTRGRGPAHVDACGQGRGIKNLIFCGRHKWMAPCLLLQRCSNSAQRAISTYAVFPLYGTNLLGIFKYM